MNTSLPLNLQMIITKAENKQEAFSKPKGKFEWSKVVRCFFYHSSTMRETGELFFSRFLDLKPNLNNLHLKIPNTSPTSTEVSVEWL